MKSVLITGAAGFIGRHAIAALAERDVELHAVVLPTDPPLPRQGNLNLHTCDILDASQQERLFSAARPSHLLHLAWYTAHGKYWTSLENARWVQGSIQLLRNFHKSGGTRIVCAGTCAEYQWGGKVLSEEGTPTNPATLYGVCKDSFRQILSGYCSQAQLSWAWGRIFLLYGPHENPQRFVPSVIRNILRGEEAKCTDGRQIRDYLYVEDVARGFISLLESGVQGPVNIASGDGVPIGRIASLIAEKLGRPELLKLGALPSRPEEPARLVADARRLFDEVGWKPQYPLDGGVQKTIDWWKSQESA